MRRDVKKREENERKKWKYRSKYGGKIRVGKIGNCGINIEVKLE